ncbi:MAG: divergent PAP2 family protein [Ktedonobacteraceae bacterium]|nr:divergent PAP2 family protein [Ktedonobacteraceae bacterium]
MTNLFDNHMLIAALLAWATAQVCKATYEVLRLRKFSLSRLVSSGGMPSSHSALVAGLATAAGRHEGVASPAFALAVVLAGIVMYDAAGVRYAVGVQAHILNEILQKLFHGEKIGEQRLYELVGHTPLQVFAGCLLGILVGLFTTY